MEFETNTLITQLTISRLYVRIVWYLYLVKTGNDF